MKTYLKTFLLIFLLSIQHIQNFISQIEYEESKKEFLEKYGSDYGYNNTIDQLREKEFSRMNGSIYLDYTAAGQYQKSQIEEYSEKLKNQIYNNPHSLNPSSFQTNEEIDQIRTQILKMFNADPNEYSLIFTSGATGALKLVGEAFPWSNNTEFWYTQENHNSVIGLRELNVDQKFQSFNQSEIEEKLENSEKYEETIDKNAYHLFAFPGEENFSGKKFPLEWINKFQNKTIWNKTHWIVLLDAAAYVPTNKLDLKKYPADLVVMSFYKIFGFPTGVGALIAKTKYLSILAKSKKYFGGGTVVSATSKCHWFKRPDNPTMSLEDGTIPFNIIPALKIGFNKIQQLGIENIHKHTQSLTNYLSDKLNEIKHSNGLNVVEIYGNHFTNREYQGAIVTFSIIDKNGHVFGYNIIQENMIKQNIHIRVGSACNPGACYASCKLPEQRIIEIGNYRESCGDTLDVIDDRPTGGIRASLGYPATFEDIYTLIEFIKHKYIDTIAPKPKVHHFEDAKEKLKKIFGGDEL